MGSTWAWRVPINHLTIENRSLAPFELSGRNPLNSILIALQHTIQYRQECKWAYLQPSAFIDPIGQCIAFGIITIIISIISIISIIIISSSNSSNSRSRCSNGSPKISLSLWVETRAIIQHLIPDFNANIVAIVSNDNSAICSSRLHLSLRHHSLILKSPTSIWLTLCVIYLFHFFLLKV